MNQKLNPKNLLSGVLSFVPIVYVIGFLLFMAYLMRAPSVPKPVVTGLLIAHLVIIALMVGLSFFYLFYILKSGKISKSQRTSWIALLFVGNVLSFPLFWYILFWKGLVIKGDTAPTGEEIAEGR